MVAALSTFATGPGLAQSQVVVERPALRSSIYQCAISRDGSISAAVRTSGRVELYDSALMLLVELEPPLEADCLTLDLSPDGRRLTAQLSDGRLLLWKTEGYGRMGKTQPRTIVQFPWDWVRPRSYNAGLTWAPDSSRFLTIDSLGHRRMHDADGELLWRFDAEGYEAGDYDALWHEPSLSLLLRNREGVAVYDRETGARRMRGGVGRLFASIDPPTSFALSSDGTRLAVGSGHLRIDVFDFESGDLLRTTTFEPNDWVFPRDARVQQLRFSPNGRWLAMSTRGDVYVGLFEADSLAVKFSSESIDCYDYDTYRLHWWPTSDRLLCGADDERGSVRELRLGERISWHHYRDLSGPQHSDHAGIAIQDGELVKWRLAGSKQQAQDARYEEAK